MVRKVYKGIKLLYNMEHKTTISISNDLWKYLVSSKLNPKETYEDVIWRFIKEDGIK